MAKIIGLTGGIASGKSTVSRMLSSLGGVIIDADVLARSLLEKGSPALKEIELSFGIEFIQQNGDLNREKLAYHVFNNMEELKKLNAITHPKIIKEIKSKIMKAKEQHPKAIIVLDAALLIEMNLHPLVDEVWLVKVSSELQLQRLMERNKLTIDDAKKRIDAQMSQEEKVKYADKLILNNGNISELKERVFSMWNEIL